MTKFDWGNFDLVALLQSKVAIGALITIITSGLSIAGHTIPADGQQTLVDNLSKICEGLAFFAGLFTLHARTTAQAENATTILPKKDAP